MNNGLVSLDPCGMTIVNVFISLISSLHADSLWQHDKLILWLFQADHCSSLACVTAAVLVGTIGCVMHGLAVCLTVVEFLSVVLPLP